MRIVFSLFATLVFSLPSLAAPPVPDDADTTRDADTTQDRAAVDELAEPVNLDLSFQLRPQKVPTREAIRAFFSGKFLRFGGQDLGVAALAMHPGLKPFEEPMRRLLQFEVNGHMGFGEIVPVTLPGDVVTTEQLVARGAELGSEVVFVAQIDRPREGLNPVVTLLIFSPGGEEWGRLDATGTIVVRSAEQYRRMVRRTIPVRAGVQPRWNLAATPLPVGYLTARLPERSVVCASAVTPAVHDDVVAAVDALRTRMQSELAGSKKVSRVVVLQNVRPGVTRAELLTLSKAQGCTATVAVRVMAPDDELAEAELMTLDVNGGVRSLGSTQRIVVFSYGVGDARVWQDFHDAAFRPTVASQIIERTSQYGSTRTRSNVIRLVDKTNEIIEDARLDAVQGAGPAVEKARQITAQRRRNGELFAGAMLLPLLFPGLGAVVGSFAGSATGGLFGLFPGNVPLVLVTVPAGLVAGFFAGGVVGGVAGLVPAFIAGVLLFVAVVLITAILTPQLRDSDYFEISQAHNRALVEKLGLDPVDAGEEYFPFPEDYDLTGKTK